MDTNHGWFWKSNELTISVALLSIKCLCFSPYSWCFNIDYLIASSYKFLTSYGVGPNVLELSFTDKKSDNYEESLLLK